MKIKEVKYWKENMNLTRPYAVTYVMHDSVENLFIQIILEDDTYGLGAGSPSVHVTGEIFDNDFATKNNRLSEFLVGRRIETYQVLIFKLQNSLAKQPALLAALDMALFDAFTKSIGISLGEYLGVNVKPMHTSITIGIKSLQETIEEGKEYEGRGFKAIKLKIGNEINADIEKYLKLREVVNRDVLIRVDANQGFNAEQLLEFINATKTNPVEFFEQPMVPGKFHEMRALSESIRMNCAGDEDVQKLPEAVNLAQDPLCFGIYNIKLMKCGGISEALRIADVARTKSIGLMWGCMDESCISISAALIGAMRCPNTKYLDLDGSLDLARDIAKGGFIIEDGVMYPIQGKTGLGVELI